MRFAPLFAAALLTCATAARGAPADLDPAFDPLAITQLKIGFGYDNANAIFPAPGGKILVAGSSSTGDALGSANAQFSLIRLNGDGSLDFTFASRGKAVLPMGKSSEVRDMKTQTDGKILLAGHATDDGGNRNLALVRYLPDGTRDSSFGDGGVVITDAGGQEYVDAMQILSDGKILVVGTGGTPSGTFVARYLPNGSKDASFDGDGFAWPPMFISFPSGIAVQRDGKILVSGSRSSKMAVGRLLATGAIDTSFNGTGTCEVPLNASTTTIAEALAIQERTSLQIGTQDKIVLTGRAFINSIYYFAAARVLLSGALDTTFDGDGYVLTPAGTGGFPVSQALYVQTSEFPRGVNRIVIGGHSQSNEGAPGNRNCFTLLSYHLTGALDTSFGDGGKLVIPVGPEANVINDLVIRSGKVLAAGSLAQGNYSYDMAVTVCDLDTGELDTSFDGDGIKIQNVGDYVIAGQKGAIPLPDGRLAAITSTHNGDHYLPAVAVMLENGAPDLSFGEFGSIIFNAGEDATFNTAAQLPDGRLLVAGSIGRGVDGKFFIARFLPDGAPDLSFDGYGYVFIDMAPDTESISHIALLPDGRFIVAGQTNTSMGLARYHPDGTLDTGFGTNGKVLTAILGEGEAIGGLIIQPDGKILVGVTAQGGGFLHRLGLLRLLPSGADDNTFGSFGRVTTSVGDYALCLDTALQSDGKIVLSGTTLDLNDDRTVIEGADVLVARYLPSGTLDNSFGGDGIVITPLGIGIDAGYKTVLRGDGKILVSAAAAIGTETRPALIRYLPDGTPDTTYAPGGIALAGFSLGSPPDAIILDRVYHFDSSRRLLIDGRYRIFGEGTGLVPLQITSMTRLPNGHIRFQGTGMPAGPLTLRSSSSTAPGGFTALGTIRPSEAGAWTYDDTGAPGAARRFYQLTNP